MITAQHTRTNHNATLSAISFLSFIQFCSLESATFAVSLCKMLYNLYTVLYTLPFHRQ